jgi:hypothetical protein
MKKLLMFSLLLIVIECNAQLRKGDFLLGGSLGFSQRGGDQGQLGNHVNGPVFRSWSVKPEAAYFLDDKLSVGFGFGYYANQAIYKPESSSVKKFSELRNDFAFIPNARRYFRVSETFNLFTGIEASIAPGKGINKIEHTDDSYESSRTKYLSATLTLNAGATYNIASRFVLFGRWSAVTMAGYIRTFNYNLPNASTQREYLLEFNANGYGNPFNAGVFYVLR